MNFINNNLQANFYAGHLKWNVVLKIGYIRPYSYLHNTKLIANLE